MKRVLTGAVLIVLVVALLFADIPWVTTVVSALLALLAAYEFRNLAVAADAEFPLWWLIVSTLALFAASFFGSPEPLTVAAVSALVLFTANAFRSPLPRVFAQTGAGALMLLYIAYPLTLIPRILALEDGTALLLFVLLCVWCGDIAALYVGRSLGRRKLAPSLSPNKTWEGSIASVGGSLLFGMGLVFLGDWFSRHNSSFTKLHTSWPWWQFFLLAILLNVAAQIGDLAESALKRGAGVKDSGTLLPGHGGILDRIDALLFAAPAFWLFVLLRNLL